MKKTFTLADILKIQLILYKKTTRLTFENSNGGMSSPELDVYFGKILRVSSTLFWYRQLGSELTFEILNPALRFEPGARGPNVSEFSQLVSASATQSIEHLHCDKGCSAGRWMSASFEASSRKSPKDVFRELAKCVPERGPCAPKKRTRQFGRRSEGKSLSVGEWVRHPALAWSALLASNLSTSQKHFCETHFTTYQQFVADQSAISPFLGGVSVTCNKCVRDNGVTFFSKNKTHFAFCKRELWSFIQPVSEKGSVCPS